MADNISPNEKNLSESDNDKNKIEKEQKEKMADWINNFKSNTLTRIQKFETKLGHKLILMSQTADKEISSRAFRIVGIFDAEMESTEKQFVFVHTSAVQQMLKLSESISEISIILPRREQVDRIAEEVRNALPGGYAVRIELSGDPLPCRVKAVAINVVEDDAETVVEAGGRDRRAHDLEIDIDQAVQRNRRQPESAPHIERHLQPLLAKTLEKPYRPPKRRRPDKNRSGRRERCLRRQHQPRHEHSRDPPHHAGRSVPPHGSLVRRLAKDP